MCAAGAADRPGRWSRRRSSSTARDRRGARGLVHVLHGRAGLPHIGAGAARRSAAQGGDHRAARLRDHAADPATRCANRGLRESPRRRRTGEARRRGVLVGHSGGSEPRPRLRPVRRTDPRGRDHRVGLTVLQRRAPARGALLRPVLGGRALPADARRAQGDLAPGPPLGCTADGDGGDHDRGGSPDDRQLRHQVREHDRPRCAGIPRRPDQGPRGSGIGPQAAGRAEGRPHERARQSRHEWGEWPPRWLVGKAGQRQAPPGSKAAPADPRSRARIR